MYTILKRITVLVLLIGFSLTSITAQSNTRIEDSLKLDPSIRYGRLPNGFTYYIKSLPEPQSRLNMDFYIKAGNDQQDADQLDLAHAVEHMAFRGAKHFPNGLLNDMQLLTSLGMQNFDINGTTSYQYTKYSFNVPPDHKEAFDTGFLFFHDIATDLKLTNEDINEERGVLRQEFVFRNSGNFNAIFMNTKLHSKLFPCKQDWSNFFENNEMFDPKSLIKFYKDWYRPDLMALSIVGNIDDIDAIERQIKNQFSDIEVPMNPRERLDCYSEYYSSPKKFVSLERKADSLSTNDSETVEFQLFFKDQRTWERISTWEGIQRELTWQLLTTLLNDRFKEATKVYNSFFRIYSRYSNESQPSSMVIKITSENNMEKQALEETMHMLQQLNKYGISKAEWTKARKDRLRFLEKENTEDADYWIQQIRDHYVYGEALPDNKATMIKESLSELSLEDINDFIRQVIKNMPENIGIIASTGHKALSYSEGEVRQWINQTQNLPVTPYIVPEVRSALMSTDERAVLKEKGYTDKGIGKSGARELVLDNGVKVVLQSYKPSSGGKKDRIILHGFRPKGASCFPKQDYFSAINAPNIVRNAGVGDMDKFELNRFLSETSFWQGVLPYVDYTETGIRGDSKIEDLEKMFQLVYLYFTNPRQELNAFTDWKAEENRSYTNTPYSKIQEDFKVAIYDILGDSSTNPMGTKRFKGLKDTHIDKAYEIYRRLYGNAKDFTFLISGDFPIDKVLPLVRQYLGNLPNLQNPKSYTECNTLDIPIPQGPSYEMISAFDVYNRDMKSAMFSIRGINKVENPYDWKEQIKVKALGSLINSRIRKLRSDKGAALYDTRAGSRFNRSLSWFDFFIYIDCIPEDVEWIRKECKKIISEIKKDLISDSIFLEIRGRVLYPRYDANRAERNTQMAHRLYEYYRFAELWIEPTEVERFVKSITREDIRETAKKYLKDENLFEYVMK